MYLILLIIITAIIIIIIIIIIFDVDFNQTYRLIWARTCTMQFIHFFFFPTILSTRNKAFQSNPIGKENSD